MPCEAMMSVHAPRYGAGWMSLCIGRAPPVNELTNLVQACAVEAGRERDGLLCAKSTVVSIGYLPSPRPLPRPRHGGLECGTGFGAEELGPFRFT